MRIEEKVGMTLGAVLSTMYGLISFWDLLMSFLTGAVGTVGGLLITFLYHKYFKRHETKAKENQK